LHFFQLPLHAILVEDDFLHRKVVQEGLSGKPTTLHCQGQENFNPSR
jgi:hypothetical protein